MHGHPQITGSASANRLQDSHHEEIGLYVTGMEEGLEVMTHEGIARIKEAIRGIDKQINEAQDYGDTDKALRLREKRETMEDYITKALGKGGRARTSNNQYQQMAGTVESAIRHCLTRHGLKEGNPLAAYLHRQISKGQTYSFIIDTEIDWKVFM